MTPFIAGFLLLPFIVFELIFFSIYFNCTGNELYLKGIYSSVFLAFCSVLYIFLFEGDW